MEEYIRRMIREEIRDSLENMFVTADSQYTDHDWGDADSYLSRASEDVREILLSEIQRLS